MSCSGIATVASIPPERRDEVRVASDLIGTKLTCVRSCCGLSHQSGLAASTVLTSTSRETSLNGPVPLAFRDAKFSLLDLRSLDSAAPFCSDHSLSIM